MEVSKSYTIDTYDIERQQRIAESLARIKRGKTEKKKETKLTKRESVIKDVQDIYYGNLSKKRELTEFFENMADYIIKIRK